MNMLAGALSAAFWGLLFLSVLVFVHEGGHYVVARLFGVRVTEFYLGLPCRYKLFHKSKTRGTELGITPLLLGGYNRICGMEAEPDELLPRAFEIVQREGRVPAEAVAEELGIDIDHAYKLLVGLSDIAAIRPFYDEALGEHPSQKQYPAAFCTIARDPHMLTEYDVGHDLTLPGSSADAEPRPLADADAQLADEISHTYAGISVPKRIAILCAGPLVNLILAFLLVTCLYATTEYTRYLNTNVVGSVEAGSIAEAAGIQEGDEIVRVDGTAVTDWDGLSKALAKARRAKADFSIDYVREGVAGTLLIDLPEGEEVEVIGVSAPTESYHLTLAESAQGALGYAQVVLQTVARLIMPQHTMEVLDQSSSVVGISVMASEAVSAGFVDVLALMAAVSMSLGFMNLLPIPPLDGGKIVVELVQLISRRRMSLKAQAAVSYVGLAFFIFVFVVALRNDVVRILFG